MFWPLRARTSWLLPQIFAVRPTCPPCSLQWEKGHLSRWDAERRRPLEDAGGERGIPEFSGLWAPRPAPPRPHPPPGRPPQAPGPAHKVGESKQGSVGEVEAGGRREGAVVDAQSEPAVRPSGWMQPIVKPYEPGLPEQSGILSGAVRPLSLMGVSCAPAGSPRFSLFAGAGWGEASTPTLRGWLRLSICLSTFLCPSSLSSRSSRTRRGDEAAAARRRPRPAGAGPAPGAARGGAGGGAERFSGGRRAPRARTPGPGGRWWDPAGVAGGSSARGAQGAGRRKLLAGSAAR